MTTLKEEVKHIIDILPDDATWDDLMYECYVRQKIDIGLKAVQKGKTIPLNTAKARLLNAN